MLLSGITRGYVNYRQRAEKSIREDVEFDYLIMHGAGNRILVIDSRGHDAQPPGSDVLRRLGDASTGPGFDQLMWVTSPPGGELDAAYRIFNADGSEVEQCGNGVRCVAWMLAHESGQHGALRLASPAGVVDARIEADGRVTVSMGAPEFEPSCVPFVADGKADRYLLSVGGEDYDVSVLSMGNPHCVLQVADTHSAEVARLGPLVERHERFPERVNASFMAVRGRKAIDLRVHERGVGETPACGTGACAAVVAGQRLGQLDDTVTVSLPGGQLVVSWRGGAEPGWLTGNAELISEGKIDL
jgi:diaminopimelate epimerase